MHLYDQEAQSVPVVLDLDPACPPVRGDAQQLRQVIHNLLQNAQDATESRCPDGETAEVILRTAFKPASGRVRMSVVDSGGGFPRPFSSERSSRT